MEASPSTPSSSDSPASGANMFLADLPSRGLFSSSIVSTVPGSMRVYVCDHDTTPPDGQEIKTNQQNILIRSLTLKKQKTETSSKVVKATASASGSRKRSADRAPDPKNSAKKAHNGSQQEDYNRLTVERLRALLKEKGLPCKGRKDELITRLKSGSL